MCEVDIWVQYFAWDATSQVTFSHPLGFLDKGVDVRDLIFTARKTISYFAILGNMPWLDKFLDKNPVHRIGPPTLSHAAAFFLEQITTRVSGQDNREQSTGQKDFLDHFLAQRKEEKIDDNMVITNTSQNVIAGSEIVATAIKSIFYFALRNPEVYAKLKEDLHIISVEDMQNNKHLRKLSYLTAFISEGMRLIPSIALHLERVVPKGGIKLPDGRVIPPGTVAGMNPWVLHRQPIFGHDTEKFRPERWLRGQEEEEEVARERMCIGKELAMMEIYLLWGKRFGILRCVLPILNASARSPTDGVSIQKVLASHSNP